MIEFNHLNMCESAPKSGDVLAIKTKKSKDKIIMCQVKEVIGKGDGIEIILQKSTNSFFNWSMYNSGESWVWRVWNLGDVQLTTSVSNMNNFSDF